jgi:hypothetical protein
MLCILAFIIFLILFPILGFFPEYRRLFRKAWSCVFKKVTLKPCDINLGEELKNKVIAKIFSFNPKMARFFDKTFAFWAFVFVVINIWSLGYVAVAGLNLWVHDTCTPSYAEACALGGDTCSIPVNSLSFEEAMASGRIGDWAGQPFKDFGDTLLRVPDRLKTWKAEDYLPPRPTFYTQKEGNKIALEIIDPSCQFCKKMFQSIKESSFNSRYNLSYITYPISDNSKPNGYRFPHSYMISSYLEALKIFQTQTNGLIKEDKPPLDWQLLEKIFTENYQGKDQYQYVFNYALEGKPEEAEKIILQMLEQIGLNQEQINQVSGISKGWEVKNNLEEHKNIVDKKVRTLKIPTIIFGGRRYDRALETDFLNRN